MKKQLLFFAFLPLYLSAFAVTPCDRSKESCSGEKKSGIEEFLPPPIKPEPGTERFQSSIGPAERTVEVTTISEIPVRGNRQKVSFENPGYLLLWAGIIAALYFYLGGKRKKKRSMR